MSLPAFKLVWLTLVLSLLALVMKSSSSVLTFGVLGSCGGLSSSGCLALFVAAFAFAMAVLGLAISEVVGVVDPVLWLLSLGALDSFT